MSCWINTRSLRLLSSLRSTRSKFHNDDLIVVRIRSITRVNSAIILMSHQVNSTKLAEKIFNASKASHTKRFSRYSSVDFFLLSEFVRTVVVYLEKLDANVMIK